MKSLNLKVVLFSLVFIVFGSLALGQEMKLSRVHMQLNGTSTIHDWTMNAYHGEFSGTLNGKIIENAKFVMKAEDLQSNRKGMDANAYKALNTDKYPNIIFEADKLQNGMVDGKLTINNVTRNVRVPLVMKKTHGFCMLQGEKDILMTDFGVTPPTFYNAIKTADEVRISFTLILKNK